jgi:hypothetical protein
MTEKNYDRHYRDEKYESAIGAFGVGLVFLFVAILSIILRTFNTDFIGISAWGIWMFIPAFFIILGGFSQLYTNYKYKKDVKSALADRNYQGTHKLENLALEVGIKPSDLLQILIDLRQKGEIRYKFNPDSGEIVLGQGVQYQPSPEFKPEKVPKKEEEPAAAQQVSAKKNFCPYCGHQIRKGAKFCENCGSEL